MTYVKFIPTLFQPIFLILKFVAWVYCSDYAAFGAVMMIFADSIGKMSR